MEEEYEFKPKRVTLDELYDIFMSDAYKNYRYYTGVTVKTNDKGERYVEYLPSIFTDNDWHYPLLYKHIVAEQFLRNRYKADVENYLGESCLDFFPLLDLWLHPLTWSDPLKRDDLVVDGRFAVETFDRERNINIGGILAETNFRILCDFVKNPQYEYNTGSFRPSSAKPLHDWTAITCNTSDIEYKIISGERISIDDVAGQKRYNSGALFRNISAISDRMGKKKAAELLLMLRDEWKTLRSMKLGTENMTEDELNQFEYSLYNGFDDFMKEWKEPSCDFTKLITAPNPKKVLEVLHQRIDGQTGKAVGIVLAAATYKPECKVLSRTPKEEEFNCEFPDVLKSCTWRSISVWLKKVNKLEDLHPDIQEVELRF